MGAAGQGWRATGNGGTTGAVQNGAVPWVTVKGAGVEVSRLVVEVVAMDIIDAAVAVVVHLVEHGRGVDLGKIIAPELDGLKILLVFVGVEGAVLVGVEPLEHLLDHRLGRCRRCLI